MWRRWAPCMSAVGWGWKGQCRDFGAMLVGTMEKKRKKKKSQPGDAQKLMRAWIKIAAQSVTWYYFHARGGGICCFLWMNAKVSSCQVSPLYQPPETSGCAHTFCQRVPLREALPISPWQPRALLQVFIWASGCLLPFAGGNK